MKLSQNRCGGWFFIVLHTGDTAVGEPNEDIDMILSNPFQIDTDIISAELLCMVIATNRTHLRR